MSGTNDQAAPASGTASVGRDYDAERKQRNAEMVAIADLGGCRDLLADAIARGVFGPKDNEMIGFWTAEITEKPSKAAVLANALAAPGGGRVLDQAGVRRCATSRSLHMMQHSTKRTRANMAT